VAVDVVYAEDNPLWILVAFVCAVALTLAIVAIGLVVLVPAEFGRRALEARERRHVQSRPVLR